MTTEDRRPIFREDAVRRYLQGREQTMLPRFVAGRITVWLWIVLGLLLASGVVVWLDILGQVRA